MPRRQVKALEGPGSPVRRDRNKSVNSEACAETGDQVQIRTWVGWGVEWKS